MPISWLPYYCRGCHHHQATSPAPCTQPASPALTITSQPSAFVLRQCPPSTSNPTHARQCIPRPRTPDLLNMRSLSSCPHTQARTLAAYLSVHSVFLSTAPTAAGAAAGPLPPSRGSGGTAAAPAPGGATVMVMATATAAAAAQSAATPGGARYRQYQPPPRTAPTPPHCCC